LGSGNGAEAWERADRNAQVGILKNKNRLVDDDKAIYPEVGLMGQNSKQVRPKGAFKNSKCVDDDRATRARSLDSGYDMLEKEKTEIRSLSDGGPKITDGACRDCNTVKGHAQHTGEQLDLGPNSVGEVERRKITRRHSDGDLLNSRRFVENEGSSNLVPRFIAKFGQGPKINFSLDAQ
jgi:hypothetical protein